MKNALTLLPASLALGVALLPFFAHTPVLSAMPVPQGPGTLYCASDDGGRRFCRMDTRGGVQLVNQRSESPCIFNQTWGYDRRGVWVDGGCRADFAAGSAGGPGGNWSGWGEGYNVYCASDDMRRNYCPVDTRGGVNLVRQRSDSPCIYGRTWGYGRRGIWVDRGCRADFQIGQPGWQPPAAFVVYCPSDDMRRNFCPADTRHGVRIIRQRSESDCIYGRTWGYDHRGIWVDYGCRADFAIGGRW